MPSTETVRSILETLGESSSTDRDLNDVVHSGDYAIMIALLAVVERLDRVVELLEQTGH